MRQDRESKFKNEFRELDLAKALSINLIRTETPQWLFKITGKKVDYDSTSSISNRLEIAIEEVVQFQKKSKRLRPLELKLRKRRFRQDLNAMLHRIAPEIPKQSDAIQYEIENLASSLDLPSHLPSLKGTKFNQYQLEIDKLIDQLYNLGKRGEILKLLEQVSKSDDIFATGQFFSRKMPGYLKFITKDRRILRAAAIEKYLEIYREFSAVYEKNLCLVKCLLHIKNQDAKPDYAEIRQQKFYSTLNYVGGQIPILRIPYDKDIRDAIAHRSYYIDPIEKSIAFIKPKKASSKKTFTELVPTVTEMICITLCISLLLAQIGYKDWRIIHNMLETKSKTHSQ